MKNLFLILILLVSCASHKTKKNKPSYSDETNQEFKSIEGDTEKALERYRQLRWKDWNDYKEKKKAKTYRPKRRTKRISPKKITKRPVFRKKERPLLNESEQGALEIEMKQHLSYFCMANRKQRRFKEGESCQDFTSQILEKCKEKYWPPRSRKILSCIKKDLK